MNHATDNLEPPRGLGNGNKGIQPKEKRDALRDLQRTNPEFSGIPQRDRKRIFQRAISITETIHRGNPGATLGSQSVSLQLLEVDRLLERAPSEGYRQVLEIKKKKIWENFLAGLPREEQDIFRNVELQKEKEAIDKEKEEGKKEKHQEKIRRKRAKMARKNFGWAAKVEANIR